MPDPLNSNEFAQEPSVVIKKDRVEDLNIRAPKRREAASLLRSDIRISCNTERPAEYSPELKIKTERIKERTSFKFQWLQLDFTVAQMI